MPSGFKVDIIASWCMVKNVELGTNVQIKCSVCPLSADSSSLMDILTKGMFLVFFISFPMFSLVFHNQAFREEQQWQCKLWRL